jgi:hypothetical protein
MPRETVERITPREANARLDLGDLGLESHYLGPSGYRADIALSNARRDAIAILRPPIAASFNRALSHGPNGTRARPLELSRLLRTIDRKAPLSAFVAACMRWIKENSDCSCVIAYSDPGASNSITGAAHNGGVYVASNFAFVGTAPASEAHWIDAETGRRINRQSVYRMLGTAAKAAVAAAQPGWRYIGGSPKLLFVYPMALTVSEVLARLEALPRAARSRPFRLAIQRPHPQPERATGQWLARLKADLGDLY